MEWAKSEQSTVKYKLAMSGVDHIYYDELPGGPFEIKIDDTNVSGHAGLREKLASWYHTTAGHILLSHGASQCNFLIAGAVLKEGGAAIVESPCYEPQYRSVEVWANQIHDWPRRPENNYIPDPAELKRLLNDKIKLVCLTNLHNPSHTRIPDELLDEIAKICSDSGVTLLIDEVFLPFIERDHSKHAFSHGAISINSLDKPWGVSNLRVGWAVGDPAIIHSAYRLNNLLGVNQPYITEHLAYQILSSKPALDFLIASADRACSGRKFLTEFVNSTPEVLLTEPAGGICGWLKLPHGMDDKELVETLVYKYQTVCFPGYLYGSPGYIRVSFGSNPELTREGFSRLRTAIQSYS